MSILRTFGLIGALSAVALPAPASPLHLDLAITYLTPTVGPSTATVSLRLFESPTNGWPGSFPPAALATAGGTIAPGTTRYDVSLPDADLSQLYVTAFGTFASGPGLAMTSVFVAEPPSGNVPDALADAFGPPWIALASLLPGSALSGPLWRIAGPANNVSAVEGTWAIRAVPDVPEPSSLLLLATGLLGLAVAVRRRKSRERQLAE